MMRCIKSVGLLVVGLGLLLSSCVTVGQRFSTEIVQQITIGQTTRAEIEQNLGQPYRTGIDSGDPTASYLFYKLGLFSKPITQDLTVTYDAQGRVKAYTYNSNQ